MHKPDWSHLNVRSRANDTTGATHTALGDPSRWGATLSVPYPQNRGLSQTTSQQILRVQCADNYSRAWTLLGNVTNDAAIWADPTRWTGILELTMGVGQNAIVQQINIRAVVAALAPFYVDLDNAAGGATGDRITKAFYMGGGIIGNAISARVIQFYFNPGGPPPAPIPTNPTEFAFQLAPFNAGTGL